MKLRQKVLISLCFVFSLCLAVLSACADQEPGQSTPAGDTDVAVILTIDTEEPVAGLHFEYTVDGTLTGGLAVQPRTAFAQGEQVSAPLPLDPENPPAQAQVSFGLYLAVVGQDRSEVPVPFFYQWPAQPGTPYRFVLQGSASTGYMISASEDISGLAATPYSRLPAGQSPFL